MPGAASRKRGLTRVIFRPRDEKAALELALARMIRAAQRFSLVRIDDAKRHQVALLGAELGLEPSPSNSDRATRRQCGSSRRVAAYGATGLPTTVSIHASGEEVACDIAAISPLELAAKVDRVAGSGRPTGAS
jgi:hypothetical protein